MFVRTSAVRRRDGPASTPSPAACSSASPGTDAPPTTLDTAGDWLGVLYDVFGIELPPDDRRALWTRVRAAHERRLSDQYSR
jgi:hypothetical protein